MFGATVMHSTTRARSLPVTQGPVPHFKQERQPPFLCLLKVRTGSKKPEKKRCADLMRTCFKEFMSLPSSYSWDSLDDYFEHTKSKHHNSLQDFLEDRVLFLHLYSSSEKTAGYFHHTVVFPPMCSH
eukprot:scaffold196018_cov15-Tisochrysis_lutea.AAC.1